MNPAFRLGRFLLACAVGGLGLSAVRGADAKPALVVVIMIDQFREDYLAKFRDHFGADGFNLLLNRGAHFTQCHYRHSVTKTACGHAVVLTGVHADVHGIIANDWIERGTFRRIASVDDPGERLIGPLPPPDAIRISGANSTSGVSPRPFLATTVGDQLKAAGSGRSKVITLSSKDRSAILLGGKLADAAYWMERGAVISSTYYLKELPAWVRAFNDAGRAERYFGRVWDRVLPAAVYDAVQGPDDAPGEAAGEYGLPSTFPKRIDGGATAIGPAFYAAFESSPFRSEIIMDFARAIVENEDLGRRGVTDLLGVSLSVNDTVGHSYGPDSHEVMDATVRTDRLLADFFRFLDGRIGLSQCTIILTADHGNAPLPERLKGINPGFDAGRIDNVVVLKTAEAALDRAFGPLGEGKHWLVVDAAALLLFPDMLKAKNVAPAAAENVVREALLGLPFVAAAFTRTQLAAGDAPGPFGAAMRRSFHPARSGDVLYVPKPFWFERKVGSNHGSPYNYDTHVPLLWFGVGVKPGTYMERVGVDDVAPTLAQLLGLLAPPASEGRVLF